MMLPKGTIVIADDPSTDRELTREEYDQIMDKWTERAFGTANMDVHTQRVQGRMAMVDQLELDLNNAIRERARAKGLEDQATVLKDKANGFLLPWMASHEIKDHTLEDVGTVVLVTQNRNSLNKAKLKEELLLAGVDAGVITKAMAKATTPTSLEYVKFSREVGE